jgi:hypothetical protein
MEEKVARFRVLCVVLAVVVGAGDVMALVVGGLAMHSGLLYLMGETCSMGVLGAYVYGLTALVLFDLPLSLATVLLVVLGRKRLPRWVRVTLIVGLAAAILVPLGALGSVELAKYHRKAKYERTMLLYTSGLYQAVVSGDIADIAGPADAPDADHRGSSSRWLLTGEVTPADAPPTHIAPA